MRSARYLRKTALADCLAAWLERAGGPLPAESLATPAAAGRVTAAGVFARRSAPHFHGAAMDGIALAAARTFGASEVRPVRLEPGEFTVVDTGDPLPADADAVVMIEDVRWLEPGAEGRGPLELVEAAVPWQHVRLAGEDLVATELVLPAGHVLRPVDVAALLACGVREVEVRRRPRVAVLPTGDELVDPLAPPEVLDAPGAILETNGTLIAGLVREWGGEADLQPVVRDNHAAVRAALRAAVESADVVALNAGSSAGRDDFVPRVIAAEGTLLAHGVDIMPGKPAALGVVRGKPVLGIPGYPVSAWVVCEHLLRPLLHHLQGLPPPLRQRVPAVMGRKTASRLGNEEFLRVKAGRVGGRLVAVPLPRGAGLLSSVVRADGVVRIPAHVEGLEAGEAVELEPLRPLAAIEASLLAVGSHDLLLDLLSDRLSRRLPGASLSSAHVGSLAGLAALQRGECHLAGVHLVDEETGEYNAVWVARFFPGGGVVRVHLADRMQGLIVPPGNPLGLAGLPDLARPGVRFLNRQRGSGTRQLLDYRLRVEGLDPALLAGYDREVYTHLAVAEAVRSGAADVGLGILAAARALGLDFVPVAAEQYDLVLREDALALPATVALLDLLREPAFQETVAGLGGYDAARAGVILP